MSDKPFKPFTAEDWQQRFTELGSDASMLLGYLVCIERISPVLQQIAENVEDLTEIKKQILDLVKQQDELVKDIDTKWNSDDPSKYGLPYHNNLH